MKIFHLTSNSSVLSGGSRQLVELGKYQQEKGYEIYYGFRYLKGNPYYKSIINECGKNLHFFDQPSDNSHYLLNSLKTISPNILHVHCKAYRNFLYDEKLLNICPIIVNIGHSNELTKDEYKILEHENIKKIICVSKNIENNLLKNISSSDGKKIITILSATDFNKFVPKEIDTETIEEFNIRGDIIIGAIGSLYEYKGYKDLLSAFREFRYTEKADRIVLVIVGRSSTEHGEFLKKIVKNDSYLKNRVIFTDGQEDIPKFLSIFSLLVSSSNSHEGISGVVREAMAMKIPFICTNIGGNSEIIHNKTACLIPPNNPKELFHSMNILIQNLNSPQVNKMKEKAYQVVHTECNIIEKVSKIDRVYQGALKHDYKK